MIELGLYRSTRYSYWTEPLVMVAGNTIGDFCLYYSLSRLRDKVSIVSDPRLTTKETRVGKDGPAYFCPNIAYFGGDIDTVLVRPHLRLPPLEGLLAELARSQGYECRPSDKGIYADEAVAKWGGLSEAARFLRNDAKRRLLEQFLDRSESKAGTGVYLEDDRRRYLDLAAVNADVGDGARSLIDELISKQILYRGFIFRCSYCRNSTWFSVSEITQEFKCRRCGRSQVYTKANWKMPEEPAWFYKLDELVYQGYRQGMAVSLLALDHLRWFIELFRHKAQFKPLLVGMALTPAKPLRKRFRVAVLASGADFRAAANGVPGRVGPFDFGLAGQT